MHIKSPHKRNHYEPLWNQVAFSFANGRDTDMAFISKEGLEVRAHLCVMVGVYPFLNSLISSVQLQSDEEPKVNRKSKVLEVMKMFGLATPLDKIEVIVNEQVTGLFLEPILLDTRKSKDAENRSNSDLLEDDVNKQLMHTVNNTRTISTIVEDSPSETQIITPRTKNVIHIYKNGKPVPVESKKANRKKNYKCQTCTFSSYKVETFKKHAKPLYCCGQSLFSQMFEECLQKSLQYVEEYMFKIILNMQISGGSVHVTISDPLRHFTSLWDGHVAALAQGQHTDMVLVAECGTEVPVHKCVVIPFCRFLGDLLNNSGFNGDSKPSLLQPFLDAASRLGLHIPREKVQFVEQTLTKNTETKKWSNISEIPTATGEIIKREKVAKSLSRNNATEEVIKNNINFCIDYVIQRQINKKSFRKYNDSAMSPGDNNLHGNKLVRPKRSRDGSRFYCHQCNYSCKQEEKLEWHKNQVHELMAVPLVYCDQCDFTTSSIRFLRVHVTHSHVGKAEGNWVCIQCGFRALEQSRLARHMLLWHKELKYQNLSKMEITDETSAKEQSSDEKD